MTEFCFLGELALKRVTTAVYICPQYKRSESGYLFQTGLCFFLSESDNVLNKLFLSLMFAPYTVL